MNLKVIYTDRHFVDATAWHLIFEWEDIFSRDLDLKLTDSRNTAIVAKYVGRVFNFASRVLPVSEGLLFFLYSIIDKVTCREKALYIIVRDAKWKFYFAGSHSMLPLIIDFWKTTDLPAFYKTYKNCRALLIPDLEVYNHLKENKCPIKIYHFPLSLPDKYKLSPDSTFEKIYDIIIPGRINIVLWHYLQTYLEKFPEIEFLHMVQKEDLLQYCNSNKSGIVGVCENRDDYMQFLRSSKVAFYATPGIDGGENRTGGFNPVTPRFLEMISAGCHVIARYPKNEDTRFFEMGKISFSVESYDEFELQLTKALNNKQQPIGRNSEYLTGHYTSVRVKQLKEILSQMSVG